MLQRIALITSTVAASTCAPGEYVGNAACQPCPANTFSFTSDSLTCLRCPSGTFSKSGAADCLKCNRLSACGALSWGGCPAGFGDSGNSCQICLPGFSRNESGPCAECPAGHFASAPGSAACSVCPVGFFSGPQSSKCSECAAGKYTEGDGASECGDATIPTDAVVKETRERMHFFKTHFDEISTKAGADIELSRFKEDIYAIFKKRLESVQCNGRVCAFTPNPKNLEARNVDFLHSTVLEAAASSEANIGQSLINWVKDMDARAGQRETPEADVTVLTDIFNSTTEDSARLIDFLVVIGPDQLSQSANLTDKDYDLLDLFFRGVDIRLTFQAEFTGTDKAARNFQYDFRDFLRSRAVLWLGQEEANQVYNYALDYDMLSRLLNSDVFKMVNWKSVVLSSAFLAYSAYSGGSTEVVAAMARDAVKYTPAFLKRPISALMTFHTYRSVGTAAGFVAKWVAPVSSKALVNFVAASKLGVLGSAVNAKLAAGVAATKATAVVQAGSAASSAASGILFAYAMPIAITAVLASTAYHAYSVRKRLIAAKKRDVAFNAIMDDVKMSKAIIQAATDETAKLMYTANALVSMQTDAADAQDGIDDVLKAFESDPSVEEGRPIPLAISMIEEIVKKTQDVRRRKEGLKPFNAIIENAMVLLSLATTFDHVSGTTSLKKTVALRQQVFTYAMHIGMSPIFEDNPIKTIVGLIRLNGELSNYYTPVGHTAIYARDDHSFSSILNPTFESISNLGHLFQCTSSNIFLTIKTHHDNVNGIRASEPVVHKPVIEEPAIEEPVIEEQVTKTMSKVNVPREPRKVPKVSPVTHSAVNHTPAVNKSVSHQVKTELAKKSWINPTTLTVGAVGTAGLLLANRDRLRSFGRLESEKPVEVAQKVDGKGVEVWTVVLSIAGLLGVISAVVYSRFRMTSS